MIREEWWLHKIEGLRRCLGSIRWWSREVLIFCRLGSVRYISCFNCNRLLRGISRWEISRCWSNCLGQQSSTQSRRDAIVNDYKKGIELEVGYHLKRGDKLSYLSNWWFCSAKSLPSGGCLSYTLGCLAFWRLTCEYCWGSWGFHQFFQSGCSWSDSWGWTWWIIFYGMPFSVHTWRIKFGIRQ